MASKPTTRGARRALSFTLTALLVGVGFFAQLASAAPEKPHTPCPGPGDPWSGWQYVGAVNGAPTFRCNLGPAAWLYCQNLGDGADNCWTVLSVLRNEVVSPAVRIGCPPEVARVTNGGLVGQETLDPCDSVVSDRNAKENFAPVNTRDVLERLAGIPVTTWNYKTQDASVRHLGPMAQDFVGAFPLGEYRTGTRIGKLEMDGVQFAAIQGLNLKLAEELAERDSKIANLEVRLAALERLLQEQGRMPREAAAGAP